VQLKELRIENLRNIESQTIEFAPGLNLIEGGNGAGKTSILEAAYVLSHGSSFRTHKPEFLSRRGGGDLSLFGRVAIGVSESRLGMLRRADRWIAKIDGDAAASLAALFSSCAVVCFEPGSHALISGAAEGRRGFVDWGMFHVEPEFTTWSKRFRRALRQRNALLKQQGGDDELAVWDDEMIGTAEPLTEARQKYLVRLAGQLSSLLAEFLPELGKASLHFKPGWDRSLSLREALAQAIVRDRLLGHTTRGPHRADWVLSFEHAPTHEQLSRGQEKLCAIACMLAQAHLYRDSRGDWPIVALDDFCSELDTPHQELSMRALIDSGAQILLTGTELPQSLTSRFPPARRFHVEQGKVQALL
jgi:DNA replication and repair protein RecF